MLKRIKRSIALLGVLSMMICMTAFIPAKAAEPVSDQGSGIATYDMVKGGTQEFDLITEDGKSVHITVTEVQSSARVANNTYKVQYDLTGCWIAGFNVKVTNNSFVSASNAFCDVRLGYISSPRLTLNSSKMATYSFNYHTGSAASHTGVRATISGTKLNVNVL